MERDVRVVLELLVGERALATPNAWKEALDVHLPRGPNSSGGEPAKRTRSTAERVVDAVATIVPHLSDYKTFYEPFCGLLTFCQQECINALFSVVCNWLVTPSASVGFRRWLFAYVRQVMDAMVAVEASRWKQSLLVAALQEPAADLRITILQLIDRRVGSLEAVVGPRISPQNEQLRLLVFCWTNSEKLGQSSALCAAKFVALTREPLVPSQQVLALLRWGRLLKPLFFDNFVENLMSMQALRRGPELELHVPQVIETFFVYTARSRDQVQIELQASLQLIQSAAQRRVQHIRRAEDASWLKVLHPDCVDAGAVDQVVLYLRRELCVLPSDVFAPVFFAFAILAAFVLQDTLETDQAIDTRKSVIDTLFGLLMLRSDSSSLLLVLSLIIDLQVPSLSLWQENPARFLQCVEQLSESVILEIDTTKKWILQAALHQLVLECEVTVLHQHAALLAERLPHSTYNLACHRWTSQ